MTPHARYRTRIAVGVFALFVFFNGFPRSATAAFDDGWATDASSAETAAKQSGKDLLLLFTGSDWCPPCIKLEENVLGRPAFLEGAQEKFVLVKFDFPQNTPQPDELVEQNNTWADRYGIDAYPTLVLVDEAGRPFAFTGFREEGPEQYLAHLSEFVEARKKRDSALQRADDATGLDRARLLDEALSTMDSSIVQLYYSDIMEEIGTLDTEDLAGLRTKYFAQRDREMRQALMSDIAMAARLQKPDVAIEFIETILEENRLPLEFWLQAQTTRLRLLRSADRIQEANALVDEMAATPELDLQTRQRLYNNKARYLTSLGRGEEAIALLNDAIKTIPDNLLMAIALGDVHDSLGDYAKALEVYERTLTAAAGHPDVLLEVVQAKADVLVEMGSSEAALSTLDSIAANTNLPAVIRAECLLHKSMIHREAGDVRLAIISENRAVGLVDDPAEKAAVQKLVDQFRRKFAESGIEGGN